MGIHCTSKRSALTRFCLYTLAAHVLINTVRAELPLQEVTTVFEYDGNGNVIARVDGNGYRTLYTYDKVNRLATIDYPDGAAPDVRLTYDANGNLTSMTDWTGTTCYTYDVLDRLARVDGPDGNTVLYWYDAVGNITLVACGRQSTKGYSFDFVHFPDDNLYAYHVLEYTYDSDNRLESIKDCIADESTAYTYDKAGNVSRCDLPNDCYTLYGYDADGRLVTVEHRNVGDGLLAKYEYTLNSMGHRTKVVETTASGSKEMSYAYDLLDRLKTATYPDGRKVEYDYDSFGNRTKMTETRGGATTVTEYTYDSDSRLLSTQVNGIEDERFSYDAIGNSIRRTSSKRQIEYAYDHENRLVHYRDGTNEVRYTYDGAGNRVARTANDRTSRSLYDINRRRSHAIADLDSSGLPTQVRVWGHDLVSARAPCESDGYTYLHDSPAGNVRQLLDPLGHMVNRYEYDAFGTPHMSVEQVANDYRFAGQRHDEEAGLLQFAERYFDLALGRALTRETYANPLPPESPYPLSPIVGLNQSASLDPVMKPHVTVDEIFQKIVFTILTSLDNLEKWKSAPQAIVAFRNQLGCAPTVGRFASTSAIAADGVASWWNFSTELIDVTRGLAPLSDLDLAGKGASEFQLSLLAGGLAGTINPALTPLAISLTDIALDALDAMGLSPYTVSSNAPFWSFVLDKQRYMAVPPPMLVWEVALDRLRHPIEPTMTFDAVRDINGPSDPNDPNAPFTPPDPNDGDEDDIDPGSLRFSLWDFPRNGFFPPVLPAPTGISLSEVGGVTFDKAATVLAEMSDIKGVIYDAVTGQLVLYGEKDVNLPPMNLDDFVVVARALCFDPDLTPEVSIEPPYALCSDTGCNEAVCATVRYGPVLLDGKTGKPVIYDIASGTHFGWVMFEADRTLKSLTQGIDNLTCESVVCHVPGFKTMLQRRRESNDIGAPMTARFWFRPETIKLVPSLDGKSMVFSDVVMRLDTESKYYSQEVFHDAVAEGFAQHFNDHYDDFAEEFPIFAELRQLAKIVGALKWIVENDLPLDLSLLSTYEPAHYDTPAVTPMSNVCQSWLDVDSGQVNVIGLAGGVTYAQDLTMEEPANGLESQVLAARPDRPDLSWTASIGAAAMQAAALPLVPRGDDTSLFLTQTDVSLQGSGGSSLTLTRYFNSFETGPSLFGWGWEAVRFELRPATVRLPMNVDEHPFVGYAIVWFIDRAAGAAWKYVLSRPYDEDVDPQNLAERLGSDDGVFAYGCETRPGENALFYSNSGRFLLQQDHGTWLEFDGSGRLTRSSGADGRGIVYRYSVDGRLVGLDESPSGPQIQLSYEGERVVSAQASGSLPIQYTYDAVTGDLQGVRMAREGTASRETEAIKAQADLSSGTGLSYTYDDRHRLTAIQDSDGLTLAEYEYDESDQLATAIQREGGFVRTTEYGAGGQKTRIVGPEGYLAIYEDDPNTHVTNLTDARGHTMMWRHNSHNQPIAQVNAEGQTAEFYYDWNDRLMAVKWPGGRIDAVVWNEQDCPWELLWAEAGQGFEDHFDQDHRWSRDEGDGGYLVSEYEYDATGRLIGARDALRRIDCRFTYSDHGVLQILDGRGYGTSYTYANSRRLMKVTNEEGHEVSFTYGDADNLTGIHTKSGSIALGYDGQDRLCAVTCGDPQDRRSYAYGYNAGNQLTTVTGPDGTVSTYTYDPRGNLVGVTHDGILQVEYEYDDLNRVRQVRYKGTVDAETVN